MTRKDCLREKAAWAQPASDSAETSRRTPSGDCRARWMEASVLTMRPHGIVDLYEPLFACCSADGAYVAFKDLWTLGAFQESP